MGYENIAGLRGDNLRDPEILADVMEAMGKLAALHELDAFENITPGVINESEVWEHHSGGFSEADFRRLQELPGNPIPQRITTRAFNAAARFAGPTRRYIAEDGTTLIGRDIITEIVGRAAEHKYVPQMGPPTIDALRSLLDHTFEAGSRT